jgi:hypothetical protein
MPIWRQPPQPQQRGGGKYTAYDWLRGLVTSAKGYYSSLLAHYWKQLPQPQQRAVKVVIPVSGWAHIAEVNGVPAASIAEINGVAVANVSEVDGVAV